MEPWNNFTIAVLCTLAAGEVSPPYMNEHTWELLTMFTCRPPGAVENWEILYLD